MHDGEPGQDQIDANYVIVAHIYIRKSMCFP